MSTVMIRWIWWITWRNNPIVAIDIWNVHEWLCFGVAQLLSICNSRCVVRPWSHALIFSEEDSAVQHIVGVRLMTLRCIWIYPKQQVGLSGMDLDYHLVGLDTVLAIHNQPTPPPPINSYFESWFWMGKWMTTEPHLMWFQFPCLPKVICSNWLWFVVHPNILLI